MPRPLRKRIWIPAGLISLLGLPVLCFWFLTWADFVHIKGIDLPLPPADGANDLYMHMHGPEKFITRFNMQGDKLTDNKILDSCQKSVRELSTVKDSLKAIHIFFNEHSNYSTLVRALDICQIENIKSYVFDDGLWIFLRKYPEPEGFLTIPGYQCGGAYMQTFEEMEEKKEPERIKQNQVLAVSSAKKFFIPLLVFIIMLVFSVIKALRQF